MAEPPVETIDEDLQSRQMAVYGRESMQLLRRANVLVSGLNGLGAEVAKNVILANVKAVTLHDDKVATAADAGSQFYLSEADAGQNRATASVTQMQELNPGVQVHAIEGAFPLAQLGQYTVVVAIDIPLELAKQADAFCRAQSPPIAFIRADVRGLCGSVFVDLGPSFRCLDPTGEVCAPRLCLVDAPRRAARVAPRACLSARVPLRARPCPLLGGVLTNAFYLPMDAFWPGDQECHRREHLPAQRPAKRGRHGED